MVPVRPHEVVHLGLLQVRSCLASQGALPLLVIIPDASLTFIRQTFPENEIRKGQLTMQLKRLRETQENITWPQNVDDLPVISWQSCTLLFLICRY